MDAGLVAILSHSIERIIAVLVGGLAIYYGFRLFLVVPLQTSGDGKIQLPGVSVVLAKAGPGIFFATFGALVVITGLLRPIKVSDQVLTYIGGVPIVEKKGAAPRTPRSASEQDQARTSLFVQTLNCIQRLSSTGPKALPAYESDAAVRAAKLALLEHVWDVKAWSDFEAFKQWAVGSTGSTASPPKVLFEAERADCPQ